MEDKKKTLTEYEKEISEAQEMEEANTHKRKVRSFKRMLMVTFLVVCAIPITLCMFLMVKMNRLDHRIENLVDRVEEGKNLVSTNIGLIDESTETMTSEQMAYGDLGKGSEGVHVALTDNGDGSSVQKEDAEATTEAESDVPEQTYYNGQKVYLTFDDGPSTYTGELLDVLKKNNVKATFFVTNTRPDYRTMIAEEAKRGHTVAIHSASHVYSQIYQSEDAYFADLEEMNQIIIEQTGQGAQIIRFPGGSSNTVSAKYSRGIMSRLVKDVEARGFLYCDWNVSSGDAGSRPISTQQVVQNVTEGMQKNNVSIVLQHDIKEFSVNAVEQIIQWGLAEGYTFLPLSTSSPMSHHGVNN